MDLKDFISGSIADIAEAVKSADATLKEHGGMVNPGTHKDDMAGRFVAPRTRLDFDVAITASKKGEGGAEAKAKIFVVEASLGGKGEMSSESVSRLSFSIDVVLPHDQKQKDRIGKVQR
ncbi:hypothetical protein [Rhodosalinus sp.]|uniref:hypothetical protein n=1 Tax=Rhodosalinus sp. TaxID=2047741 RepID=UPI00356633DE